MKKTIILLVLLVHLILNATAQISSNKPFVLGAVLEMQSKVLSEKRTLNIYVPEGYDAKDTINYPVIYLLDGAADEDFIHVVGIVQFNSFPWIHRIPKSIVVGIANVDRRRDYLFPSRSEQDQKGSPTAGGSAKFIDFIAQELQPLIEKQYKVNGDKMLIGQSAGGLLATEILYNRPALFNKYLIVSPSLWWDNASLLNKPLPDKFRPNTMVYIGVGKEGLTPGDSPHVMEVDANLLADKLSGLKNNNLSIYFDYLPQENHATTLHPAVLNACRFFYPGKDNHD